MIAILEIIKVIQEKMRALVGIRTAPDLLPDNIAAWPAIVTYPVKGTYITGAFGIAEAYHDIVTELHYPLKDLPRAIETITPFVTSIPETLTDDPWLGELCETFENITYTLTPQRYAETDTVCLRFVIEKVKIFPYGKQ